MESIKDRLLREANQAVEYNRKFMAIAIQETDKEPEVLIVPHSLMMVKTKIFVELYGDNLMCRGFKIVNWAFGSTFAELQENLG